MIENILIIVFLGILFGSFGSVLLGRLEKKHDRKTIKSILIGRSQCPHCKHTLGRDELIPLLSYLKQGGKCKHCHTPISKEYPILEILCGTIFGLSYLRTYYIGITNNSEIVFRIITNWLLMLMIIHDFKTYELHLPIRSLLSLRIIGWIGFGQIGDRRQSILMTIIGTLIFAGIYFFAKRYVRQRFHTKEEGFGQGDIFIGATLGALLPFIFQHHHIAVSTLNSMQMMIVIIIIASVTGIIYALIPKQQITKNNTDEIFEQRRKSHKIIPFIPSLILAFWLLLAKASILIGFLF